MKRALLVAGLCACAGMSQAALYTFDTHLTGDQVVPPVDTPGFGDATLTVDTSNDNMWVFTLDMDVHNLIGQPDEAHIHQAPVGANGPIVVELGGWVDQDGSDGNWSATYHDVWAMNDTIEFSGLNRQDILDNLNSGLMYAQVHTGEYPAGEVRGQFAPVPEPASLAVLGLGAVGLIRRRRRG